MLSKASIRPCIVQDAEQPYVRVALVDQEPFVRTKFVNQPNPRLTFTFKLLSGADARGYPLSDTGDFRRAILTGLFRNSTTGGPLVLLKTNNSPVSIKIRLGRIDPIDFYATIEVGLLVLGGFGSDSGDTPIMYQDAATLETFAKSFDSRTERVFIFDQYTGDGLMPTTFYSQ